MIHRREAIETSLTLANSGTRTMSLDFVDPISSIDLVFEATNGASGNKENPLVHNVTAIEIVDGGDVITSVRGEVLEGLTAHLNGYVSGSRRSEVQSDGVEEAVTIPFGRYLLDTEYALNPNAFRNPQLKITWDIGHVRAVGATSYLTGTMTLTAVANIMEGVGSPVGVMTAKEVYDFTSAASGDERVELPTDYPIRTLGVRAYENGTWIGSTISNLKLSGDGGKVLVFDEATWITLHRQLEYYGRLDATRRCLYGSSDYVATFMAQAMYGVVMSDGGTPQIHSVTNWGSSDARIITNTHAGAAVSAAQSYVQVVGTAYQNCIMVPFGRKDVPETWLDATQFGSLVLFLTNADAGGEVQVFVQEARPY